MVVDSADKWIAEVQRAKVQRAEISASEKVQTDRIRAHRDVLLKALEPTFDERRENFLRLFLGLDAAMKASETAQAAAFLTSITELARTSPFQDLVNLEIVAAELKQARQDMGSLILDHLRSPTRKRRGRTRWVRRHGDDDF